MAEVHPFRAVRARDDLAHAIIAPPYDVLSVEEARAIAGSEPRSFLHVTRPDADLPEGADPHSPEAYAVARANFHRFIEQGWMVQDDEPCFYLYRLEWRGHAQTGLICVCPTADYDRGIVKRHELTRPDKEQDRANLIEALDAQTGPVLLAWRDRYPAVRAALARAGEAPPAWRVTTEDGVTHAVTPVRDRAQIARIQHAFTEVPALYVADGHHRSAAASRVARARRGAGSSGYFLAGLFPDSEMTVLAYNRLVKDLGGLAPEALLSRLGRDFEISADVDPMPPARGRWTMYLDGTWYGLVAREGVVPDDPVDSLDVAVLQDRVLGPILGIGNPRTDPRISFVGGIRGAEALQAAVDEGRAAVAFHLYPTGLDQLFAVADAGRLMPPKSTWFEPKLRSGGVVHRIV